MWRRMTVLGSCAAGAAVGAVAPWAWYYGRYSGDWDYALLEMAGPPGLGATVLWAILGAGAGLLFALEHYWPER